RAQPGLYRITNPGALIHHAQASDYWATHRSFFEGHYVTGSHHGPRRAPSFISQPWTGTSRRPGTAGWSIPWTSACSPRGWTPLRERKASTSRGTFAPGAAGSWIS